MDESLKDYCLAHQEFCWNEYNKFKETKHKIVFFIGTLFISVLFGSSFLIYRSASAIESSELLATIDRLYVVQYILMHLFFFLLYLYYTYNNVQEKIFLIETQCCQVRLNEVFKYDSLIKLPCALIKKNYTDGADPNVVFKGRIFKDVANSFLILVYAIFSTIPLLFKKDFLLFGEHSTAVRVEASWIIIASIAIASLLVVISAGKYFINNAKKIILEKWQIAQNNLHGI